jgi:hypothetical protein
MEAPQIAMRFDEEFAARSLVQFLGGPSVVSIEDGENPPDLYLDLATLRVGVEVTRLPEPMFDPTGTSFNRVTHDTFAIRLLDELDANLGPSLPDSVSLYVVIRVPVCNGAQFQRSLTDWVCEIVAAPELGTHEREIEGSETRISVIPRRPAGKRIAGLVMTKHFFSREILRNARLILEDRIRTKSARCSGLTKPIWLAMLNDFWLADVDCYEEASRQLKLSHCFDRLFIVFDRDVVTELVVAT